VVVGLVFPRIKEQLEWITQLTHVELDLCFFLMYSLQFKNLLFWPWHCQMCNNKNEIWWKGNGNVAELSVGNWKRLLLGNENQWNCVLAYM